MCAKRRVGSKSFELSPAVLARLIVRHAQWAFCHFANAAARLIQFIPGLNCCQEFICRRSAGAEVTGEMKI